VKPAPPLSDDGLRSSLAASLVPFCAAGREGREGFGAAAGRKKKKTGGLSNREQQKQKRLPAVSRARQVKRRGAGKPTGSAARRAQRGHVRGGTRAAAGKRGGGGKRSR